MKENIEKHKIKLIFLFIFVFIICSLITNYNVMKHLTGFVWYKTLPYALMLTLGITIAIFYLNKKDIYYKYLYSLLESISFYYAFYLLSGEIYIPIIWSFFVFLTAIKVADVLVVKDDKDLKEKFEDLNNFKTVLEDRIQELKKENANLKRSNTLLKGK